MASYRATNEKKPQRAGGYVRISDDSLGLEKGVVRQKEDVAALGDRLNWEISKIYEENDTSAYRKRRIRKPDGRSVWRVIRPEFRQMLQDYEDGVIDGIIVYDLDRLVRQPRDLEDLIDLVDHCKRPVVGVTGGLDLMTDNGKAMARVLVAMANKSSANTARLVRRGRLQSAQEGRCWAGRRSFGWKDDGKTLEPEEAALRRKAALRFLAGESWSAITTFVVASGVRTVTGTKWYLKTVKTMVLSPRNAGIAVYGGQMLEAEEDIEASPEVTHPRTRALRNPAGEYVRGEWETILSVQEWEAVMDEFDRRREGIEFTGDKTRKHLLSGLLRCGRPQADGTACNKSLIGTNTTNRAGQKVPIYKCPGPVHGGCGKSQRNMGKLDRLIEDLLFLHLYEHRPRDEAEEPTLEPATEEAIELADVRRRLEMMHIGMRDGTVTTDSYFAVVPGLEQRAKRLTVALAKAHRNQVDRSRRLRSPEQVRQDWEKATTSGKRSLLGQYLLAVIVHPSQTRGTVFDHNTIEPVWKPLPS